jgi:diaminohydroxyphosphoribosylaminopyrimidine deaminase/5-amino-6-(5-phosphoribosylamino)uracil reductase
MHLALTEAKKGIGRTSPNPSVGAVVVRNGKVVGKGYHKMAGTPHAEVHALRNAGSKARNSILYVTLEPCNHTGRTPPCTEAILQAGVKRVVIGMPDPNPQVSGGGGEYLASRGVSVVTGILQEKCQEINLPFIKHATTGLPWVMLKAGMSMDGRIAAQAGQANQITNEQSRNQVHKLRDQVDAILIGLETALVDDPSLTTRLPGRKKGRDPLRVILDSGLRFSPKAKLLQQESGAQTWIFCGPGAHQKKRDQLEKAGAIIKPVPLRATGKLDLKSVLTELGRSQLNSVLVEGGSRIHGSFLQERLVDQILLFVAPVFLGQQGVPLVNFSEQDSKFDISKFNIVRTRRLGTDIMIEGRFLNP